MIQLYTDGACRGNPGEGGWGCLILDQHSKGCGMGYAIETTNNRMEMMAVIEGLKQLRQKGVKNGAVKVVSDSNYVIKGMTVWRFGWQKKDWRNSKNKEVKNKDLWVILINMVLPYKIKWQWVKGHAGHALNEQADGLANQAIDHKETKWVWK